MTKSAWNRRSGRSSSWCNPVTRLAIYIRDDQACGYCGRDLSRANPRKVTLDHLRPQCEGGSNRPSNLLTACLSCNSRRQHKPWRKFIRDIYSNPEAAERKIRSIVNATRRKLNRKLARDLIVTRKEIS